MQHNLDYSGFLNVNTASVILIRKHFHRSIPNILYLGEKMHNSVNKGSNLRKRKECICTLDFNQEDIFPIRCSKHFSQLQNSKEYIAHKKITLVISERKRCHVSKDEIHFGNI